MDVAFKCGRAMLRREWACSTGVIPRPHRKPAPQKAGIALMTPLVFQVSMGGGDCLLSGDKSARLPAFHKNNPDWRISPKNMF
uniref:SFRICE_040213 n=1 Tax=Spodoptera frugiperda TaxID=7108 RepID=A0A2H1WZE6_SPOFR